MPEIAPVWASMPSPAGRPAALKEAMSASVLVEGLMVVMGTPTRSVAGAVQVRVEGATRSTARLRLTVLASV